MAQALYRKYRSQTFEEVVGQEHVTTTLRNALREGRVAHAYLFSGPRGTGKTSTARILAKAVNCLNPDPGQRPDNTCPICTAINEGRLVDLVEMDAASHTSVDNIRELIERVNFAPTEARYKVYVIDEVHMLSNSAFNALLKTLEEPPAHVIFVLATTEPHKIPETVLSRCQRFDFRRIPAPRIVDHLQYILTQEGRQAEPAALEHIAMAAEGCMRDAVSLLDQLLSYGGPQVTLEQVESVLGVVPGTTLVRLTDMLARRDTASLFLEVHRLVAKGIELRQFVVQWARYLRDVLLARVGGGAALPHLSEDRLNLLTRQGEQMSVGFLVTMIRRLNEVQQEARNGGDVQLALEVALADMVGGQASATMPASSRGHLPASAAAPESVETPLGSPPSPSRSEEGESIPAGDEATLKRLQKQWRQVIHWFREHRRFKIQAALGVARPVRVSGTRVDLVFRNQFSMELVQQPENLKLVGAVISRVLGKTYQARCFLEGHYHPTLEDKTTEPSQDAPQSRMSEVLQDALVKEAVQQGGRIVDIE